MQPPRRCATRRALLFAPVLVVLAGLLPACGKSGGATGSGAQATPPRPIPAGLATGGLDEAGLRTLGDLLAREPSPCKAGQSLYDAVSDAACPRARIGAQYLVKLLAVGLTAPEAEERYEAREVAPALKVDVAGAPMEGDPSGTVWIAELADFQCPHCARVQADLAKVMADMPGRVRVYFEFFPLPMHPMARIAAQAAWAAAKQGKFWPYAHLLFENQDKLTPQLIDALAGQVGLDMARFKTDEASPDAAAAVQKDVDEGMKLNIKATPTLFINGRRLEGYADADEIESWISELNPQ